MQKLKGNLTKAYNQVTFSINLWEVVTILQTRRRTVRHAHSMFYLVAQHYLTMPSGQATLAFAHHLVDSINDPRINPICSAFLYPQNSEGNRSSYILFSNIQ